MPRRAGHLARPVSRAAQRLELLIFTEGAATETSYLRHWEREHRHRVRLEIDERHGRVPRSLVEIAVERKRYEDREARKGRGKSFDQVWCVLDVDAHPNVPQAVNMAIANNIQIALSNPCIELWFVLHFEDQAAHIERDRIQSRARALLAVTDKRLDERALLLLMVKHADAVRRAQRLAIKHEGDGKPVGSNPSSTVYLLVETIRSA